MINAENFDVFGFEAAVRGMRNPMNSWNASDSLHCCDGESSCENCGYNMGSCIPCPAGNPLVIGKNDLQLMRNLVRSGSDHGKFMRMITATMDITAPLYWWKEFDTYKIGTVANSCSTMHKIHAKEFTLNDFSHEHLDGEAKDNLFGTISVLNHFRKLYNETKEKKYWWQMIQLLPSSYNQRRTVQLNYEVMRNMYNARKDHKLDEWRDFCKIISCGVIPLALAMGI